MNRLFLFFALFSFPLFGSNALDPVILGTVTGTVIDEDLQEPIPYATISVLDTAGTIFTGTVSSMEGTFTLEKIPEGKYTFQVQYMGYTTFSQEIEISSNRHDLSMGNIFLKQAAAELDDVTIVAEISTIEQRIDRKVINVGKDLTTSGASASDIMNNIPSVSVDQDGNIALRGNQNVKILVDGKPSNVDAATLLKQIPSTSIKSIELITNPSAKHNPEGMSGIINIILHKNSNLGFNGDVAGGITIGKHNKYNGSLNLNYRTGKFNFYTNLGGNDRKNETVGYILNSETGAGEHFTFLNESQGYLGKLGVDFYLDDNNVFSFYTNQNRFLGDFNADFALGFPNQPSLNYTQFIGAEMEGISSTYNFDYKRDFQKEGHNIELEIDYNLNNREEESNNTYSEGVQFQPFRDFTNNESQTTIVNLDYVNPLTEATKLEFGAEARIMESENDFESTNTNLDDIFYTYDRNIFSLYTTYGQNFESWSYQVGARAENFSVEAVQEGEKIYEDDYFTLYPSAFVTYTPGETNSFQMSYSRRVDRPALSQVNPIRQFASPRLTGMGNPELKPQFTNSVELNYTRKMGRNSITAGIFYRLINDDINQVMLEDPENPNNLILTFHNTEDNSAYGAEVSGSFKPAQFWDLSMDFNLYSQSLKGVIGSTYVEEDNTSFRFQTNNSFRVNDQLKLQLFGMYVGPMKSLQFDVEDFYFVNMGARYSFLEDKASLSLNVNDVFNTQVQKISTERPQPQIGRFKNDSRTLYLGFSYRFGGGKNAALRRKQRDDNTTSDGGIF